MASYVLGMFPSFTVSLSSGVVGVLPLDKHLEGIISVRFFLARSVSRILVERR